MANKITYENKELLQNDETIPSKNKVTAKDLNEIKEVVNSHAEIIATKQEKEEGKGLSSNDFTDEQKEKLEGLENYDDTEVKTSISNLQNEDTQIKRVLDNKVDKISGKNLSQNDFTDNYKSKLDNLSNYDDTSLKTQINANQNKIKEIEENKVNKVIGKSLSTNDFTNECKEKLDNLENYNDTNIKIRISTLETDNTVNKQEIENIKQTNIQQNTNIIDIMQSIEINENEIRDIKEKNSRQDESIQKNINNIESIQKESIELREECERLKEDIKYLPTIAGSGENVTLKDTAEARFKEFGIGGNTVQEGEPSLESPSEIKNVEEQMNITICNKNLFNAQIDQNFENEDLGSGIIYIRYNAQTNVCSYKITVREGKDSVFAYFPIGGILNRPVALTGLNPNKKYVFSIGNKTDVNVQLTKLNQVIHATIMAGQTKAVLKNLDTGFPDSIVIYVQNKNVGDTFEGEFQIQIEEGENVSEYEEHHSQSFTFPLEQGQILHQTDYLVDEGIHHRKKTVMVDGVNYGTQKIFENGFFFLFNLKNNKPLVTKYDFKDWTIPLNIKCNRLPTVSQMDIQQGNRKGVAIQNEQYIIMKLDNETEENNSWTVETVHNFLQNNPITIEYTAPEEIESYTEEQQIVYDKIKNTAKSYKGTTHIYSTNEIGPIFEVEARKDIQAENEKLQTQINEIKELLSTTTTSAMLLDNMQTDLEKEVM